MATVNQEMNMFLVHGKNGLYINSCISGPPTESKADTTNSGDESATSEVIVPYSSNTLWSLNRCVRCYSTSPNNNVAIVDDRLGLSILHAKSVVTSEFAFDTLRGVGKFRNLYTPIGCKNIKYLQWSNNGVYLVIYFNLSNYSKETGAFLEDNLHIWDISQKCIVGSFCTRRLSPEQWPIIKWVGNSDKFVYCYGQQVSLYAITSPEGTFLKSTRLLLSIPIPRVFSVEVFYHKKGCDLSLGTDALYPGGAPGLEQASDFTVVQGVTDAMRDLHIQTPTTVASQLSVGETYMSHLPGNPQEVGNELPNDEAAHILEMSHTIDPSGSVLSDATGQCMKSAEEEGSSAALPNLKGQLISIAAYTKADISAQMTGNLRISTIECMGGDMFHVSSCDHELKTEDSAEMLWSPSGKYLLVLGQSTVDLAGEKYGSTSNCLLFRTNGSFVCRVNTKTIHDARWCPTRDEFIIMEGNMPCDITLYNSECVRLFEFPKLYRNTIKWNPLGNMVALCGFGNLAGEICFWYRKDSGEYEQIVHLKEPCTVVSEWSHDSRYFLAASTFPRMKVDNFLKIFSHEGDLLESKMLDECYGVGWISSPESVWQFVRPRVRKSLERKAVYRPKILPKDDSQRRILDAETDPIINGGKHVLQNYTKNSLPGEQNAWNNSPSIVATTARTVRENHRRASLFSSDHGDKSDPSVDLLDAFRHVFSMPQMCPAAESNHFDGHVPPYGHRVPMERDVHMENGHHQERRMPSHVVGSVTQEDAAKSLSMLMRIKKQMQCEKSKPLQQTILDEVQLLKLLLEAKNRSVNRARVE
ncbi:GYF domain-containing protein [Babesia ovis]|uniref:GYF domain-containing protein n=1 Tax=Babesia ovis TaxID=5869 RepID=A0A9W5WUE7_BABOV|nr:GYF domain-containing protein [Babesia ovis]